MTKRAEQLGMENSTFMNSNGWPQAGHRMSVKDLAILANRLITDFPGILSRCSPKPNMRSTGRAPSNTRNRNPLLTQGIGADGLKTGHTSEAGYGLVGSAKQGDRRVIFVVSGLESERGRSEEAAALVNWSFRQFAPKTVASAGDTIAQAEVWMGRERSVGLVPAEDLVILVPVLSGGDLQAEVVYKGPIPAPIQQGQPLAELVITPEELPRNPPAAGGGKGGWQWRVPGQGAHRRRTPADPVHKWSGGVVTPAPGADRGLFISFEGIDGSGKSTQSRRLADTLRDQGRDVVLTREPGGSPGAEEIRALVLEGAPDRWSAETEILLFTAARRDHLERTIEPALAAGKVVICDRFADSTRMYQGVSRGDLRGLGRPVA